MIRYHHFLFPIVKDKLVKETCMLSVGEAFEKGGSKKKYLWTYYIVSLVFSLRADAGSSITFEFLLLSAQF